MGLSIQEEYNRSVSYIEIYCPRDKEDDILYVLGFRRDMMTCSTFNRRWHLRKRIYRMLRDILLQTIQEIKPLALTHRDGTDADGGVWEVMEIDLSPFTLEPSLVDDYFNGYKPKILTIKMFEAGNRPMVNCLFDGAGFF